MSSPGQLSILRVYQASGLETLMRRVSERSLWCLTSLTLLALLIVGFATARSMSRFADSMNAVCSHTLTKIPAFPEACTLFNKPTVRAAEPNPHSQP